MTKSTEFFFCHTSLNKILLTSKASLLIRQPKIKIFSSFNAFKQILSFQDEILLSNTRLRLDEQIYFLTLTGVNILLVIPLQESIFLINKDVFDTFFASAPIKYSIFGEKENL